MKTIRLMKKKRHIDRNEIKEKNLLRKIQHTEIESHLHSHSKQSCM